MYTLHRIMVCTDLSSPARHAAERAALVAASSGARIDVVHVMAQGWRERVQALVRGAPADVGRKLDESICQDLDELVRHLRDSRGVDVRGRTVDGPVVPTLAAEADRTAADLIVLGARGAGFMRHALLGSTAERDPQGALPDPRGQAGSA